MKHGTVLKIGNTLFDYSGKTSQGYLRGRHSVTFNSYYAKCDWVAGSDKGNVMYYTTKEFELATPEEIEIFNRAISK